MRKVLAALIGGTVAILIALTFVPVGVALVVAAFVLWAFVAVALVVIFETRHIRAPLKLQLKKTSHLATSPRFEKFYTTPAVAKATPGRAVPPAATRALHPSARWIAHGEAVTFAGYPLRGGMVYFGVGLHGAHGEADPSLIDPRKPVGIVAASPGPRLTDYWPSYALLTQEARAGYLAWLEADRNTESVDLGFLFLFFYGLERRVLLDGVKEGGSREEWPAIATEIRRLLARYVDGVQPVVPYFVALLEFMEMTQADERTYLRQFSIADGTTLPFSLRLALGQAATDGAPVPASLAFAWQACHPAIIHRTAVTRCTEEFAALFPVKYEECFGAGLVLRPSSIRLRLFYRPASLAFGRGEDFEVRFNEVTDVTMQAKSVHLLQMVVDACNEALKPYSRKLLDGQPPAHSFDTLLPLPMELWPATAKQVLEEVEDTVRVAPLVMRLEQLTARFSQGTSLSSDRLKGLCRALASRHIATQPDLLVVSKTPKSCELIGLFLCESDPKLPSNHDVSLAYQAALCRLELYAALLPAKGPTPLQPNAVDALLTSAVDALLGSWTYLLPDHLARLRTCWAMRQVEPPTTSALKKRFAALPIATRQEYGDFARDMAYQGGLPTAPVMRQLESLLKILGLDPLQAYGSTASPPCSERKVIAQPLDGSKIAALQRDSVEVGALLQNIFADDAPPADVPEPSVPPAPPTSLTSATNAAVMGLDQPHAALVGQLAQRSHWLLAEVRALCDSLGLMPNGALERINEAAFDLYDEPLIEGDDPLVLNLDILSQLTLTDHS